MLVKGVTGQTDFWFCCVFVENTTTNAKSDNVAWLEDISLADTINYFNFEMTAWDTNDALQTS